MFEYIYIKVVLTINLSLGRSQKLQILVSSRINFISKINSSLNRLNMIKSIL